MSKRKNTHYNTSKNILLDRLFMPYYLRFQLVSDVIFNKLRQLELRKLIFPRILAFREEDFLEIDDDGKAKITLKRERKLIEELARLKNAEQYALCATKDGFYPCYHCPTSKEIFLKAGQIWKYGSTTLGQRGRYRNTLTDKNLVYIVQFTGNIQACLEEEKRKIYYYPLLPENLNRNIRLIRPPGNKKDILIWKIHSLFLVIFMLMLTIKSV